MSTADSKEPVVTPNEAAKTPRKMAAKAKSAGGKSKAAAFGASSTGLVTSPDAKTGAPAVASKAKIVVPGPVMRKKELIDKVVERSGMKRKDAKPVVEAVLEVLGAALGKNRELALTPMGKFKVRRERKLPNGRMMVVKIRQPDVNKDRKPAPEHDPDIAL